MPIWLQEPAIPAIRMYSYFKQHKNWYVLWDCQPDLMPQQHSRAADQYWCTRILEHKSYQPHLMNIRAAMSWASCMTAGEWRQPTCCWCVLILMLKSVRKGQHNNIKMGYHEKSKSQTPRHWTYTGLNRPIGLFIWDKWELKTS